MEMSGQLNAPAALFPGITDWIGGWVGPTSVLDAVTREKIVTPLGNPTPVDVSVS